MKNRIILLIVSLSSIFCLLNSCTSTAIETIPHSTPKISSIQIMDEGIKNVDSLIAFFLNENPQANKEKVTRMANYYRNEASLEGVNSDVAFAQMCLETGFLRFGGLVTEEMNNFCGLGAIDENNKGNIFETEQIGVRAHIQHLKAYGSTESLTMPLVDPRYKWVTPKGKAPDIYGLAGTWAADMQYGIKIHNILSRLEAF